MLLLVTPSDAFKHVVPFLVAAGALALIGEPWLRRRWASPAHRSVALGVLARWLLAAYSGYFGAGSGVMTLALMLIMVERRLPTANALKNMLIGAATVPAARAARDSSRPVHWAGRSGAGRRRARRRPPGPERGPQGPGRETALGRLPAGDRAGFRALAQPELLSGAPEAISQRRGSQSRGCPVAHGSSTRCLRR